MTKLIRILSLFLFTGLIPLALCFADPYTDLNIDFLLNDTTKVHPKKPLKSKKKDSKKPFKNVIKEFQKIEGLFTLYWKKEISRAFLAINPDQLEKIYLEMISLYLFS